MDAEIRVGDTVAVSQKIQEAKRERVVTFKGRLLRSRGKGENQMITVRNMIDGVSVDRIFPVNLPTITAITLVEKPKKLVRRARLMSIPKK
jgi:large subunit ribosomal protein L19